VTGIPVFDGNPPNANIIPGFGEDEVHLRTVATSGSGDGNVTVVIFGVCLPNGQNISDKIDI
jgi:hypothetical protein